MVFSIASIICCSSGETGSCLDLLFGLPSMVILVKGLFVFWLIELGDPANFVSGRVSIVENENIMDGCKFVLFSFRLFYLFNIIST